MASPSEPKSGITKLANCRLLHGNELVVGDLFISSITGKIVNGQAAFYDDGLRPDRTINLGGRIVSPGFIDCQLNGAFGFNFSTVFEDVSRYDIKLQDLNRKLVQTGVTSYLPTLTSQASELYHAVLPHLAPSGCARDPLFGAESLGAHVEGPFLNPSYSGIHNKSVIRPLNSLADIDTVYGPASPVKLITLAPELLSFPAIIPALRDRSIIVSLGHTSADYATTATALLSGATMLTHLFNAMPTPHHRAPGPFGTLSPPASSIPPIPRPFYGLIADGIHLSPSTVLSSYRLHPSGAILVTDGMHPLGLPDGTYPWRNGNIEEKIVKKGALLRIKGREEETISGGGAMLLECVNNFVEWTGGKVAEALRCVTETPARMLEMEGRKGGLGVGGDADLVVLSEGEGAKGGKLVVDEVWKFGVRVFEREGAGEGSG